MKAYFMVFGSSTEMWRLVRSSGNTFADGCSEPFLQKSGLSGLRTVAANHTRPSRPNMPLWLLALESQIFWSPQYGEGCVRCFAGASGVSTSRTGIRNMLTLCDFGSRIGMLSVDNSGEPKSGP